MSQSKQTLNTHHQSSSTWKIVTIVNMAILFVIICSCFPLFILIDNIQQEAQTHRVWWLTRSPIDLSISLSANKDHNKKKSKNKNSKLKRNPLKITETTEDSNNNDDKISFDAPIDFNQPWIRRNQQLSRALKPLTKLAFCGLEQSPSNSHWGMLQSHFSDTGHNRQTFNPYLHPFQPWIFDAGYSSDRLSIHILAMEPTVCQFNQSTWFSLVKQLKQQLDQQSKSPLNQTHSTHNNRDISSLAHGSPEAIRIQYDFNRPIKPSGHLKNNNNNDNNQFISNFPNNPEKLLFSSAIFINQRIICRFYDSKMQFVASMYSYRILPGMLIRCPLPTSMRSMSISTALFVRLQIPFDQSSSSHKKSLEVFHGQHLNSKGIDNNLYASTKLFTVCPQLQLNSIDQKTVNNQTTGTTSYVNDEGSIDGTYAYNISMCMSTTSHRKSYLLEWIEYHRMIGVQHFFLYDRNVASINNSRSSSRKTSRSNDNGDEDDIDNDNDNINYGLQGNTNNRLQNSSKSEVNRNYNSRSMLQDILLNYIDTGIVTVIPWPYLDCVDGMACDHTLSTLDNVEFSPPPKLQKYTSMMSCYMRFKSSSKWIAFADDNEFIGINSAELYVLQSYRVIFFFNLFE